jgi:hypothetical protein
MKTKVKAQTLNAQELTNRHTTQIFGWTMSAVFVAMLVLAAVSY